MKTILLIIVFLIFYSYVVMEPAGREDDNCSKQNAPIGYIPSYVPIYPTPPIAYSAPTVPSRPPPPNYTNNYERSQYDKLSRIL